MLHSLSKRRPRNPLASLEACESRLLLTAPAIYPQPALTTSLATGQSPKRAPTPQAVTEDYDGFWSGYAQTESTEIVQNGKKVQVTFYAPSNWAVANGTPIYMLEQAVGKGKVKGDRIRFVVSGYAKNGNTNEIGLAKLTFDERIDQRQPTYKTMTGTVIIKHAGRTYQADEFAVHYF